MRALSNKPFGWVVVGLSGWLGCACGNTSHSATPPTTTTPTGGAASAGAGAGGEATTGAAGADGGAATTPVTSTCSQPLSEWTKLSGLLQTGVGTSAYVGGALALGMTDHTVSLMAIDEQHPEVAGALTLVPQVTGIFAAGRSADFVYLAAQTSPLTLLSVAKDGTQLSAPTTFMSTTLHDNVFATSDTRVVMTARQPNATVHIETFDTALKPLMPFDMPAHAASAVQNGADGLRLATIDNASKTLQIYALSDQAPELVRSHALTALSIMIAWAGDSVVIWFTDHLTLIEPDDTRTDIPLPDPTADPSGIAYLNATQTPYGTVMSIDSDNLIYIGLFRNGAMEWDGPYGTLSTVFADLRADDHSFGAYSIETSGGRNLIYSGRRCP